MPYLIGLTGNIATGKSSVARTLCELGADFIDADEVAHAVMMPGGGAYHSVIDAFGPYIINDNGTIDRKALGAIVFANPDKLKLLESLVHPPTLAAIKQRIADSTADVVVVEAIKLLESKMADEYDVIWVTTCTQEEQVNRLMASRAMSREQALLRIEAQPPQSEKLARADVIIDTNGSRAQTRKQILAAWHAFPQNKPHLSR